MPWKRSDITTEQVLQAYSVKNQQPRPRVDEHLVEATGAPHKVVWTAMQRDCDRGLIEYGVNLRGGWLTDLGKSVLQEAIQNGPR